MYLFSKKIDMLEGSLWDKLIVFAIPLALVAFLEQLFNVEDLVTLGRFVGKDAVAAVGSNLPLIGLFVSMFMGLSLGSNVVIAQCLGGRKWELANQAIHTSLSLAVVWGLFLTLVGQVVTGTILDLLQVPDSVRSASETYLRVYLMGLPFISLFNFEAAIFRSRGNTKDPLIALIFATVINGVLNIVFVHLFTNVVAGVALATDIAMMVAASILFRELWLHDEALRLAKGRFYFQKSLLKQIVIIGWPAALQGMVFCLANMVIQEAINSLGPDVMAASSIGISLEVTIYCLIMAFGQTATTFISQNYGAGNLSRCYAVTKWCMVLNIILTIVLCTLVMIFAESVVRFFNDDSVVVGLTINRMWIVLAPEFIQIFIDVLSGAMRGFSFSLAPALLTMIGICGVRILWVYTVFAHTPTFERLMLTYPVSWLVTGGFILALYMYFKKHLLKYMIKS